MDSIHIDSWQLTYEENLRREQDPKMLRSFSNQMGYNIQLITENIWDYGS